MTVDKGINSFILEMTGLGKMTVHPEHLAFQSIYPTKRSVSERKDCRTLLFRDTRHFLLIFHSQLRKAEEFMLHRLCIEEEYTLTIHHKPHILISLYEYFLGISFNTDFLEPFFRIAIEFLVGILINTVSYRSMYP